MKKCEWYIGGDAHAQTKKYVKMILLCGLVIGLLLIWIFVRLYLRPKPIMTNDGTWQITEIRYKNDSFRGKDIETCSQQILSILSQYECKPTFQKMRPYSLDDVVVEIDMIDLENGKRWNILLGDIHFCYEHAGSYICNIPDADELLEEIEKVVVSKLPV